MGRPVIVPDLPVFRDEIGETPAGFLFRAGSSESLAATLDLVFANPTKLREFGILAREHVRRSRIWNQWLPEMWRQSVASSLDTTNA
jgi:glycosyltransferase involved in cell wall biosynthesis